MSITRHRSRIRQSRASLSTRMTHITTERHSAMPGPPGFTTRRTITTSSSPITDCRNIIPAPTINTRS